MPSISQLPIDLREAFENLLSDASGPFGAKPLVHLIRKHTALLAGMRQQGASWAQITHLLATHGVVAGGSAVTADVVRATYARAAKNSPTAERKSTERNAPKDNETNNNEVKRHVTQSNVTERDDTNPNKVTSAELSRRSSMIDKPWHMR